MPPPKEKSLQKKTLSERKKEGKGPFIMGILNTTPDSFYDGGQYETIESSYKRALVMEKEGADIIDIGGESSKPFAQKVSEEIEMKRVLPLLEALTAKISCPLSIDTYKPKIAMEAAKKGVRFLNDITGFKDPKMIQVAREFDLDICLMHMQKDPETMQINPTYPHGVVEDVYRFFEKKLDILEKAGIQREKVFLDPGIGFGKTVEDNFLLINNLSKFAPLGSPLMIGASRKSFLQKSLQKETDELLLGTVIVHTMSLMHGADILRVHDVKEHKEAILLFRKKNGEI